MKKVKNKEEIIKNGEKKSKRRIASRIFALFVSIIIIVVAAESVINLIQQPSDSFVVEEGTLSLEETADAYIIRTETVLQGENYKNGMEKTVAEGKKVAKGETVFRYYANGEEELEAQIDELNAQILEAEESETSEPSSEIETIKEQIRTAINNMKSTNNLEEIENYRKEISEYNSKIISIIGENSAKGSYLKELIEEKEELEEELYDNAESVVAEESGIVSYRVDGYEDVLTTDDFDYLTKDFLEGLDLNSNELIDSSTEKGKIVTSFETYLVVILSSEKANEVEVGETAKLDIGASSTVKGEIVEIKDEENDEKLIVFKIIDISENTLNYRKITIDIIWWSYSGLKVPNTAIKQIGDYSYVVRNRAGYDADVLVKVLQSNGTYSLVDNYTSSELSEMGYSSDEIRNMYTIKVYDKIKTYADSD